MKTKLVNVKNSPYDTCIMRSHPLFGNKHRISYDGDRAEVILKHKIDFYKHIREDDYFLRELLKLRGTTLGCCCVPEPCHGDTYVDFLNAKVIGIVGSRRRNELTDLAIVEHKFLEIYKQDDVIVSGGCPTGGDRFAEILADKYQIPIMIFRAFWGVYGGGAGFVRNTDIAKESWDLIACTVDDRTGGTEDTIKKFMNSKPLSMEPNYKSRLIIC